MAVAGVQAHWQDRTWLGVALLPITAIYAVVVGLRRMAYESGLSRTQRIDVPVVVVGNITVGGTGKTPLVLWLAEWLAASGWRPGIVSRGYRGQSTTWPREVTGDSDPMEVGDEPVLLAQRSGAPVWVGPDRVAAARRLIDAGNCDVLLSDDGLQHYALGRDIEIAVLDGDRRFGNGWCLPSGPLREPPGRLRDVDAVVVTGTAQSGEYSMGLRLGDAVNLVESTRRIDLGAFRGDMVHGVAGIGNPRRFFEQLRDQGMRVVEHPFPDHHAFTPDDLMLSGEAPILMTEKDAVKCRRFASARCWMVPASADPEPALQRKLVVLLDEQKTRFRQ